MLVKTWSHEGFKDIEINETDIKEFGIINSKLWNRNGTFKKWFKKGFIITKTGEWLNVLDIDIKILKEQLKGKYTTKKHTEVEYKNHAERKATDWTYTIID
jgi:hypothetical protein